MSAIGVSSIAPACDSPALLMRMSIRSDLPDRGVSGRVVGVVQTYIRDTRHGIRDGIGVAAGPVHGVPLATNSGLPPIPLDAPYGDDLR